MGRSRRENDFPNQLEGNLKMRLNHVPCVLAAMCGLCASALTVTEWNNTKLNDIAARRGQTLAQMALSWVLKDDVITSVLIGASRPEQITENLQCVNAVHFSDEELRLIDEASL